MAIVLDGVREVEVVLLGWEIEAVGKGDMGMDNEYHSSRSIEGMEVLSWAKGNDFSTNLTWRET